MAELAENEPVNSLVQRIKISNLSITFFPFGLSKETNWTLCCSQLRAISIFLINLLITRDRKGHFYLYCGTWLEGE